MFLKSLSKVARGEAPYPAGGEHLMSELPGCVTLAGHIGHWADREPGAARNGAVPVSADSSCILFFMRPSWL